MERYGKRQSFRIILPEKDAVLFEAGVIKLDMSHLSRTYTYRKRLLLRWVARLLGRETALKQIVEFRNPEIRKSYKLPDGRMEIDLDCTPVIVSEKEVKV